VTARHRRAGHVATLVVLFAALPAAQMNANPNSSPSFAQAGGDFNPAPVAIRPLLPSEQHTPDIAGSPDVVVRDVVLSNTDPSMAAGDRIGGSEPSIAVDPTDPARIVVTSFSGGWWGSSDLAPLWYSADGGRRWTKEWTIPRPAGSPHLCPCDQTVDFDATGRLVGTFLDSISYDAMGNITAGAVYTGSTADPTRAAAWTWPGGVGEADPTVAGSVPLHGVGQLPNTGGTPYSFPDQPWLASGPDPVTGVQTSYVSYIDQAFPLEDMRVAAIRGSLLEPTVTDRSVATVPLGGEATVPAVRVAVDPIRGTAYAIWAQQGVPDAGPGGSTLMTYMLNRSTDGGRTWGVDGDPNGIPIGTVFSNQEFFTYGTTVTTKWATVNATLGGVHSVAVDPSTGDVLYVYGDRDPISGVNTLAIRRVAFSPLGLPIIGEQYRVTAEDGRLPSVAVASNGTIGVLYTVLGGFSSADYPQFSAHLAQSIDGGRTFHDETLLTWTGVSPAQRPGDVLGNDDPRQRELGDYQQLKAVGDQFYGVFTGNGAALGRPFAIADPIFMAAHAIGPPAGESPGQ